MNWTPGPWEFLANEWNTGGISESAITEHRSHSRGSIVAPRRAESPWFIATMENAPEQEANACLIAAAPKLYEALEAIAALDDGDCSFAWTHAPLFDAAHAALEKARGEAMPKKEKSA